MVIPKLLHRVWLGPKPISEQEETWWRLWGELHPGWQLLTWREKDLEPLGFSRIVGSDPCFGFQSDVARLLVLGQHGGVYVDTDVEPLRCIEPTLEGVEAFYGRTHHTPAENAVLGCTPRHPWYATMQDHLPSWLTIYAGAPTVWRSGHVFMRKMLNVARALHPTCQVVEFPEEVFYPGGFGTVDRRACVTPLSVCIHWWKLRWVSATSPAAVGVTS